MKYKKTLGLIFFFFYTSYAPIREDLQISPKQNFLARIVSKYDEFKNNLSKQYDYIRGIYKRNSGKIKAMAGAISAAALFYCMLKNQNTRAINDIKEKLQQIYNNAGISPTIIEKFNQSDRHFTPKLWWFNNMSRPYENFADSIRKIPGLFGNIKNLSGADQKFLRGLKIID